MSENALQKVAELLLHNIYTRVSLFVSKCVAVSVDVFLHNCLYMK